MTAEGRDLRQLIQKFLLGAVAFHQAVDDYLDEGLESDNTQPEGDAPYTTLEHAWDEAFGYFGASRDYGDYTDEEVVGCENNCGSQVRNGYGRGFHDTDGDGQISFLSEVNLGVSVNAAKRDLGSHPSSPTDFSGTAFDAFVRGRRLIARAKGPLNNHDFRELYAIRDQIVGTWEAALAATAVHYINETLRASRQLLEMDAAYSFSDHAKVWSELKGFSLGLQFNPRSPLSNRSFVQFHELVGDRPVVVAAGEAVDTHALVDYMQALRQARLLLRDAYAFSEANMGDVNGEGGW